ncbi:MAG TPA: NlpC/P60 family protein, partial [Epsilonproteobacteria bacterium]|nr:NlpC/P60 family protein [Campylobacterota bacterium]
RKITVSHFAKEPRYLKRMKLCRRYLSADERSRYMTCDVPLKKMKIVDKRYTTPWQTGMKLPRKAVP